MKTPVEILQYLGIAINHLVAGVAGGFVFATGTGMSFTNAISRMIIGAFCASYITPTLIHLFLHYGVNVQKSELGIAFIVGTSGFMFVEMIINFVKIFIEKLIKKNE